MKVTRGQGVLLTTYGMVLHNADALSQPQRHDGAGEDQPLWDIMLLDEVHSWLLLTICAWMSLVTDVRSRPNIRSLHRSEQHNSDRLDTTLKHLRHSTQTAVGLLVGRGTR